MDPADCRRTVLVVDDDGDIRDALSYALEDHDYRAVGAGDGVEALARLRGGGARPCVILLDIMMPVMDGRAFRAAQRRDPDLQEIPVVLLSAHANLHVESAQMEAAGYLRKPLALDELLAVVDRLCA
jgi:CheY-like chemotaxis protein